MKEDYIVVEHAVKKYKDTIALNDVSLTFAQNQIHGIIGRNGSGKTVLLKCICGLTRLTSGRIILDGKVVGKDMEIPDNIGAIIETPGFIKSFSGYDNLKYLASVRKMIGKEEIVSAGNMVLYRPKEEQRYYYYGADHPEVYWECGRD